MKKFISYLKIAIIFILYCIVLFFISSFLQDVIVKELKDFDHTNISNYFLELFFIVLILAVLIFTQFCLLFIWFYYG